MLTSHSPQQIFTSTRQVFVNFSIRFNPYCNVAAGLTGFSCIHTRIAILSTNIAVTLLRVDKSVAYMY